MGGAEGKVGCGCIPVQDEEDLLARQGQEPLLNKYDLHEVLGQGAFGIVHRARLKGTKEDFAVKLVDCVETSRSDIDREIAMMRKLAHPCIVKIYETFSEKVFVCLVLELHKGGDMISGMVSYWSSKGNIPIPAMCSLSKQMWEAVEFVHLMRCVHRDIKGDNFMMDLTDVSDLSNQIYLSDFGTVCEIPEGKRLKQRCGTSNYWAPEFFDLDYAEKVDCWATGVVMYGLISGKFPFKSERDTRTKKVHVSRRCPPDGAALIWKCLERKEADRYSASQALAHGFFRDVGPGARAAAAAPPPGAEEFLDEDKVAFSPSVRERGANGGVQLRRAELVQRLKTAQSMRTKKTGRRLWSHIGSRSAGLFKVTERTERGFVVANRSVQVATTYQWWTAAQAEDLCADFVSSPRMSRIEANDISSEAISKVLQDHNISLAGFGVGSAKTFEEFASDIRSGHVRLQLDASKHKHIVCATDHVLLRLSHGSGAAKRYLVRTAEQRPGSREREERFKLPTVEKRPHENAVQAAQRLLAELHMEDLKVDFDIEGLEGCEEIKDSPSYPGIQTVFLQEFLGALAPSPGAPGAEALKLLGGGVKPFEVEDASGRRSSTFAWLTEEECRRIGLRLVPRSSGDFSTLVYPPIGLEEDELSEYLKHNRIDTSSWGTGTARSVAEFADELVKGEATLQRMPNGKVKRVVDVVIVQLVREGTGEVLVELRESKLGSGQELKRLPAVKRRADEHHFVAARRLLSRHLLLSENFVFVDPSEVRIVEEEMSSKSYPDLPTVYRKRFMKASVAKVVFAPQGDEELLC